MQAPGPSGPPTPHSWESLLEFDKALAVSPPPDTGASAAASTSATAMAAAVPSTSASASAAETTDKPEPVPERKKKSVISFIRKIPVKFEKFKKRLFGSDEEQPKQETTPLLHRRAVRMPRTLTPTPRLRFSTIPTENQTQQRSQELLSNKDSKYWDRDEWNVERTTCSPRRHTTLDRSRKVYKGRRKRSPRPTQSSSQSTQSTPGSYSGTERYPSSTLSAGASCQTLPSYTKFNIHGNDQDTNEDEVRDIPRSACHVPINDNVAISKRKTKKRSLDKKKNRSLQVTVEVEPFYLRPRCSKVASQEELARNPRNVRRRGHRFFSEPQEIDFEELFRNAEMWAKTN